jgi:hypothetical protein
MADINSATVLEKLKRKLSFSIVDEEKDALLMDLIGDTMDHFRLIAESLSGTYPEAIPIKFEFIIKEVAEKRFNRIGSEGMTSESIDGHSVSYEEQKNDFNPYLSAMERTYDVTKSRDGRMYFI